MAFVNPFIPPKETYKRDILPIPHYVDQAAHYISIETGKPYDVCYAFVKASLRNPKYGIKIPTIEFLRRQENGDREVEHTSLNSYLIETLKTEEIMAPTLTTYVNPKVKESLLVRYIDGNVKKRGVAKKAMFAAEAEVASLEEEILKLKDRPEPEVIPFKLKQTAAATRAFFEDIAQRNTKLSNNAISGAHASPSTPLYNQTSHSTLTSNCRMTSGYGNANNEKLLSGNRHYWCPEVVLNNIVSIVTHTDYDLLNSVMSKHGLHYPSADEIIDIILYSSDLYWHNREKMQHITSLVYKLNKYQRAAFAYTGDLYHVMKYNNDFMRDYIRALSTKIEITDKSQYKLDKPAIELVHALPEDIMNLAHQICAKEMKSRGKDYKKMEGTLELDTLVSTAFHVADTITKYDDFEKMIMVSDNVPASISHFPTSIRRAALTSDTDSTIFTVQDWVIWDNDGQIKFDDNAVAVASTMIFLASQAIIHVLARMSKNAGFADDRMYQVAMKNEFFFPVFVPTNVAKHYYAIMSAQEGNVYKDYKMEIKGVHLKSSNVPKSIMNEAAQLMEDIARTVASDKKLSIIQIQKRVAKVEHSIYAGLKRGDRMFFRLGEIKNPAGYAKEKEQSPYLYHMFWEECMAPKYGSYGEPPYQVLRVATRLTNPSLTAEWLKEMKDREMAERIAKWMVKHGKKELPSMQIPIAVTMVHEMPEEVQTAMNARKIVADLSKVFYLVMETLGIHVMTKHQTKLMSDIYPAE